MTPEEEAAVRRALAATPPEGPMPPEVVDRLERTIAELRLAEPVETPGERVVEPVETPLVSLEERRRRRWPAALVAAASVAVLGYGVGTVLVDTSPQTELATDSAGSEAEGRTFDEEAPAAPQEESGADGFGAESLAEGVRAELTRSALRSDVEALLAQRGAVERRAPDDDRDSELAGCPVPPGTDRATLFAVLLNGRPGTLVLRPASGGERVAQVYSCDAEPSVLASTTVAARR